jgi:hypothetical protein
MLYWLDDSVPPSGETPAPLDSDDGDPVKDMIDSEDRPCKRSKQQISETTTAAPPLDMLSSEPNMFSTEPIFFSPRRCLVVCPTTLIGHWSSEASHFMRLNSGGMKVVVVELRGTFHDINKLLSQEDKNADSHMIFITSYNSLRSYINQLCVIFWDVIVLDEGHLIANRNSKVHIIL